MVLREARPGFAALLVALGGFCFSIMSLCGKLAGKQATTTTFSIIAFRSILGLILNLVPTMGSLVMAGNASRPRSCGCPVTRRSCKWLAIRCLGGFACILLEFAAMPVLPLGTSTMIIYSSPAWIVLWAAVLFRERIQVKVLVCLCMCFAGLFMIVQPWHSFSEGGPLWAIICSFVSSSMAGLVYVSLRELKDVSYHAVLNFFQMSCLLLSVATGLLLNKLPIPPLEFSSWKHILGVGVAAYAAEVCITVGYAQAGQSLGEISMLKFLSPIFSSMWGFLIFADRQGPLQLAGSALVLGASAAILYQQAISKRVDARDTLENSLVTQMEGRRAA